jgi:hypothetical protein
MRNFLTVSVTVLFSTALALSLTGCLINKKQQQAKIVTPPPPAPKTSEPAVRPQPLSIPQTQTQLPPPQPISPEALATVQSPPQTPEAQQAPATSSRPARRSGPVAGPKPESAVGPAVAGQSTAAAQAAPPVAPPPDAEPRATVQEIVPPAELKRLQESVAARRQETRKVLDTAQTHHLTYEQRGLVARIQSFLQSSDEAEKRNDWRQADTLAERAQVLAKELAGVDQ